MNKITEEHENHISGITRKFSLDARKKYIMGIKEHGGNLWDKPNLVNEALNEAIDQFVYIYTFAEQINIIKQLLLQDKFEEAKEYALKHF